MMIMLKLKHRLIILVLLVYEVEGASSSRGCLIHPKTQAAINLAINLNHYKCSRES
jgi:hypothetical protein